MRFITTYARVLKLLARDRRVVILLVGANFLLSALSFIDPILFGRVVQILSLSDPDTAWHRSAVLLGIWATVGAIGIGANIAVALHAERLAHRNRLVAMSRYFSHVLGLPLSFHGESHSGRLLKTMLSGADGLFGVWLGVFREHLATLIAAVVLLPLSVLLNWRLAIALILLMVLFVLLTVVVMRRTDSGQRHAEFYQSALAATAQDALANVLVVQAFTQIGRESRRFSDIVNQVIAHQFPVLNWWAVVNVLTRAASTIAVISIVLIGTLLHLRGEASVGEIVSFMGFATLLIGRLESTVGFSSKLFMITPQLDDFFAVMDTASTVSDKLGAVALASATDIAFENVSFAYPGGPQILSCISFTARRGQSIALVGKTGAGKSTAMALLQRLWDPDTGRVLIGGQDIRDVSLETLRRNIGVVFQESLLFNRSIRENLLVGRPGADDAAVEAACRLAEAHEFIIRQPSGYDTMVGERGANLSGGQRQRLAIARALLKDPPILILDEATSALDAATEARVNRALANLMAGRTTFIIAHRLSTVRRADDIVVFDAGGIVERGSFDQLLQNGRFFADLVATQLAGASAALHT
jgi:ATP-binding cassette subfamily B protein